MIPPHIPPAHWERPLGWIVLALDHPAEPGNGWALTPHGVGNELFTHGADLVGWKFPPTPINLECCDEIAELLVTQPPGEPRQSLSAVLSQVRAGVLSDTAPWVSLWCIVRGIPNTYIPPAPAAPLPSAW